MVFSTLASVNPVLAAVGWGLKSANASRIVTRHNVSIVFNLPLAYEQQIRAYVTPWQREQLQELATRRRVSLAEVLRSAVREYLESMGYDRQ